MSRIIVILGLALSVVFVMQVKDGKLATNDVFTVVNDKADVATLIKPTIKVEKAAPREEMEGEKEVAPVKILAFGARRWGG